LNPQQLTQNGSIFPGIMDSNGKAPVFRVVPLERLNSRLLDIPKGSSELVNNNANGSKNGRPERKPKPVKKPVTFALDPSSANSLIVENLEEKADFRGKNSTGQWVTTVYTTEQRKKFDADSILYYFQCVLQCPTNIKFTATRLTVPHVPVRPLKLEFTNEADAAIVLAAYQRNVLKIKT
jgi:hypothetical protein